MGAITVITLLLAYRRQQLLPEPPLFWESTRVGSLNGWTSKGSYFPELQTSQGVLSLHLHRSPAARQP